MSVERWRKITGSLRTSSSRGKLIPFGIVSKRQKSPCKESSKIETVQRIFLS